jgi:hypothetical protein
VARASSRRKPPSRTTAEAERLLLWSLVEIGKPLSSLTHEDLLAYQRFLADPQRAGAGSPAAASSATIHVGGRSTVARPTSQRQAIVIVNALFAWLVEAGYLAGNPLALTPAGVPRRA